MNAFTDVGTFLVQSLASFYLIIVILRVLLRLAQADFFNPISQFVHKATAPAVMPLRKVFPSFRQLDIAALVLALLVQWLAIQLTALLHGGGLLPILNTLWWGMLGIISLVLSIYLYGLLAAVILSWVAPASRHPAIALLWQMLEPVIAPFRKLLPPLGGLDLSPIFVFLVINMLRIFVSHGASAARLPAWVVPGIW